MKTSLKDMVNKLSPEDRKAVKQRTSQLISEEMTLRELRQLMSMTQKDIAQELHIGQDGVSRLEKRSDIMLSTLRKYITSLGGEIDLVIKLPEQPPIKLTGFQDLGNSKYR